MQCIHCFFHEGFWLMRSILFNGQAAEHFILIPGHTNGLCAMKINHAGKYVLLFVDGGYAEKSWKQMIPTGTALHADQVLQSLAWI